MPTKHLAIFRQPFLDFILEGKKTIESRFSCVRSAPYGVIKKGDIVLLKKSGGLVLGEFTAGKVETFSNLKDKTLRVLSEQYGGQICSDADPNFWQSKKECLYATLIYVTNPIRYKEPYPYPKKDRRGWVIIKKDSSQQSMFQED